jgi:hypothetical protein
MKNEETRKCHVNVKHQMNGKSILMTPTDDLMEEEENVKKAAKEQRNVFGYFHMKPLMGATSEIKVRQATPK